MAWGDFLGLIEGQLDNTNAGTATMGSARTAGNLIMVVVGSVDKGSALQCPATKGDYTRDTTLSDETVGAFQCAVYWKIAENDASDAQAFTWTPTTGGVITTMWEFEGPFSSLTQDNQARVTTYLGTDTATIGQGTLTPTTDNCLVFSMFLGMDRDQWTDNNTDTNNRISLDTAGWTRGGAWGAQNTRNIHVLYYDKQTTATQVAGTWSTSWGSAQNDKAYAFTVSFSQNTSFAVTDVDGDEIIYDGQTGVVATLTGTVSASGKRVFLEQGGTYVEQSVTAENDSSVTFDVDYGTLTPGAANLHVRDPQ